jgi:hypothetical protein
MSLFEALYLLLTAAALTLQLLDMRRRKEK